MIIFKKNRYYIYINRIAQFKLNRILETFEMFEVLETLVRFLDYW